MQKNKGGLGSQQATGYQMDVQKSSQKNKVKKGTKSESCRRPGIRVCRCNGERIK